MLKRIITAIVALGVFIPIVIFSHTWVSAALIGVCIVIAVFESIRCIGQKKHGERLVMDWNRVVGSKGRAHFKPRKYTNNNGEEKVANDIERFIDYNPEFFKDDGGFVTLGPDDEIPF